MYIKYQQNEMINGSVNTIWYVFKTEKKIYTQQLAESIKQYLVEHANPQLEGATIKQIKGWFTGKYDSLEYDEKYDLYELTSEGSFGNKKAEHVRIIEIDKL